MAESYCPDCDTIIPLGSQPRLHQNVSCSSCGAYLQVVGLSPIELDWAFEDEDAMEDEYEYEYEFEADDFDELDD